MGLLNYLEFFSSKTSKLTAFEFMIFYVRNYSSIASFFINVSHIKTDDKYLMNYFRVLNGFKEFVCNSELTK